MAAEPERIDKPTPNGGVYSLLYRHDDGSLEVVECDAEGNQLFRTYCPPPREKRNA